MPEKEEEKKKPEAENRFCGSEAKAPGPEGEQVDPDPAARRAGRGGRRGPAEAGRGPARRPGPAGGGVEVLACIVPGREPCFFLPGTPRWRPGARGPKQTGDPGPEERGVAGSPGGGAGSGPGGSVSGAAAPRAHREATGARKAPPGRRFPAPRLPLPGQLEREGDPMPNYGLGRRQAGRIDPRSGRSPAAEQREAGAGPPTSEASATPAPSAPTPLLTVGAFEGIFRPLEIGRHLGGRLRSPSVRELLSGPGRRGTSARSHAPHQQSPAPSQPASDGKEGPT